MKWSVGIKIACMNAVAIVMLLGIGVANYISTDRMLTAIDWRQHTYQVKVSMENLLSYLLDAQSAQRGYIITRESRFLEPFNKAQLGISETIRKLNTLIAGNKEQMRRLEMLIPLIDSRLENMQKSFNLSDPKQEILMVNEGKKMTDDIRQIVYEFNEHEDLLLVERTMITNSAINTAFYIIIFGTMFAVVFLVITGIILSRNIAKPLGQITERAKKIAAGDVGDEFQPLNRADEIGALSQAFAQMSNSIHRLSKVATKVSRGDLTVNIEPQSDKDILGNAIAQMVLNFRQFTIDNNEVINLLNTSVNEIFTSISQLVSTGSETATAVNETTSTIEEVRQTSQVSSHKAKSVSDEAQHVANISLTGKKATQETNEGMMRVRDQMLSIAESMMLLSEQTQGISSIVETVDDLAQQSNLLSVNASIEAEKAGEQGRGFRIVAQEIKNLADQSKMATHRVREILLDVQKATSAAVLATEQGNKAAESGVKKSEESGDAIEKLSMNVTDAAQAALQIAASSQQQLIGLEQAALAMENIKQASTQNVDSAKQLDAAAHNLKDISMKIQKLVKKYRVTTEHDSRVTH